MEKPLRVLFIEDSRKDAELVCGELKRGGYRVHSGRVDTESGFLTALTTETWDLIISDFSMPQFDGLRAFELFRAHEFDIPFIFVSGVMGEDRAVQAMKAGARDYILKGQLGRLNAAVDRELEEAARRRRGRETDAAKAREQRRLAVALQATGAGVFEYRIPADHRGYYDQRFASIFGLELDELPPFEQFPAWFLQQVHPGDLERISKRHGDFIEGRVREYAVEFRVRHKGGGWREVTCLADAAERDAAGRVTDLVGVMLDRSHGTRMEEQFRQAQKMDAVGRLAGGIAHDFNNLLTVISNFGEFVLERLEPGSDVYKDMQEVLKAARRAETLTGQLLAYSRRRPVDATALNVNDLVGDVDKMLRRLLGESIELKTDLAPDLWTVRIDSGGLEQVMVNLAVNARDAMPDGGRLCLETSNADIGDEYLNSKVDILAGQYVNITVSDNGTGMDEETQARLFEPFFTTKGPDKGTGLGLATCYGIVKQARGFIWVYSEPGHGTTFRVLLPREPGQADARPEITHSEKMRGNETVLVVEDEEPVRKLVVRLLSMLGYTVLEASTGAEALEVAQSSRTPIHLLLTDVVMPGMNGPQLVNRLCVVYPHMKVLFMSGYTRGVLGVEEQIALVQKPFAPKVLARKLREVLDETDCVVS